MGKDIDWDEINDLDLDKSPEAHERFDAALKRSMGVKTTEREDQLLREWCARKEW